MKHLTLYLLCLLISPVYAQKSYRDILKKDVSIQKRNVAEFIHNADVKKINPQTKTIERFYWDESTQDWSLNNTSDVKYLENGETLEIIDYNALGEKISKTTYFKSSNGRISGNIQYSFDGGSWLELSKTELEVDDANNEIRNETFIWSNNQWEIASGMKSLVEKKTFEEEIGVKWIFDEIQKKYLPTNKSITTYSNGLVEQTIFQDYADGAWVNRSAEGYDYDLEQKISSVYFLTWDGVSFKNEELYTNIIWHDYANQKYSHMVLKIWDGNNWVNSQKAVYQYNISNTVIGISFIYLNDEWVYSYRISEQYDRLNNPMSFKVESYKENNWDVLVESVIENTYDQQNRLTLSITRMFDGKKWLNISKETIDYKSTSTGIYSNIKNVNVYPNPSSDYFMVQTENNGDAEMNIYTLTGQKVESYTISNLAQERINVSQFSKGIYLIEIKQGSEIFRSKLQVK